VLRIAGNREMERLTGYRLKIAPNLFRHAAIVDRNIHRRSSDGRE
jgi:hypothetical protein